MEFIFFDDAGNGLFSRSDMEQGHWVQEEMSVTATFPYLADKVIERGQRIAFRDPATDNLEAFEIRNVTTVEPEQYQQLTAEHIVISELSDEHINQAEIDNKTPAQALGTVLTGTLWSVGNATATNISSCDISRGSVWQAVNTIQQNWNVYIVPRVTLSGSGTVSGRYLDIIPAGGTFRGVRLSIDKNMSDSTVTYDDTDVLTALYGYGGTVDKPVSGQDDQREELTFADEVWTATSSHPAKPAGQTFLEWPEKTALYGRNGRPRYGYYQNGDIKDAAILLQKTWEALQRTASPKICISGTTTDLKRLGYADQPLRLHDTAIVEIRQTQETFVKEIIKLDVDLVDPTANRPEIGDYLPNIIYINRDTETKASGGGGGGGRGQPNTEYKIKEFETEILANDYEISLRAYQRDMNNVEDILRQAGMSIDASGVLIYADDEETNVKSVINVTASQIRSEVADQENSIYSYIDQTASQIRSLITHSAEIYVQLEDPTEEAGGGITPEDGTIWIEDGDVHSWAAMSEKTWEELSEDYEWRQLMGVSGKVWHNGEWVPFVDHGGALLDGTRIDQNRDHIALQAGKVTGLYGELEVTASQIRSEVIDARSEMGSSLTQTASMIRAEVHAANSTLYSVIEQTATQIRTEVVDSVNSLNSSITQTASQIRAEVSDSVNSINSSITQTASQIRAEVNDSNNSLKSSITQTASQIRSEVSDSVNSLNSSITQTASQIRSEVSDSVNSLNSSITQTASQIRAEIHAQGSQLYSSIEQTASQIRAEVADGENSLRSIITQTASQIRSEVSDGNNSLRSSITQTASQIRAEVSTANNSLRSSIAQTASQIRAEVSDGDNSLRSTITQTASQIRSEVSDSVNSLNSSITQTASQIRSEVSDSVNSLNSSITQTASQIRSEVSTADNSLRSEIEQNASQIALKVSSGDVATQLAIELGNVRISGGNLIVDGYIRSDSSYTGTLYGGKIMISGGDTSYITGSLNVSATGTFHTVKATQALYAPGDTANSASWQELTVVTSLNVNSSVRNWMYWNSVDQTDDYVSGQKMITNVTTNTTKIYYLGRAGT